MLLVDVNKRISKLQRIYECWPNTRTEAILSTKLAQKNKKKEIEALRDLIAENALDKKAENVLSLDLRKLPDAVCDFFVICDAATSIQVKAIADNIVDKIKEQTGEAPHHKEGFNTLEWVVLDYIDIVVHIFKTENRKYYQLEELWLDAEEKEFK